ncbi:MAG: SBBP repeat-containing protein [Flavobacteriales bacterium]|nr:SBBP repeat-containing protein [Flavobacteriales bacterium]
MTLRSTTAVALLSLVLNASAQQAPGNDPFAAMHQRALAKGEGVLHRMMTGQRTAETERLRDPFGELQRKAGVRPRDAAKAIDYEFYGVHGYGGNVVPMATVADGEGNLYITGASTRGGDPRGRQFTLKLDASGDTLWNILETGTKYAVEHGIAITLDADGLPIVAGTHWNGTDMDIRLSKYGADGSTLWQTTYAGPADGVDMPTALTTDASGNVLVAGISWSGMSIDYLTLKVDAAGTQLWAATDHGMGGNTWNEPEAITTDADGNVYVTGFSENLQFWNGYYTVKYSASGDPLWQQRYTYTGPPQINDSYARAIAVDAEGNVYVTGTIDRGNSKFGTIKYDADGVQQWLKTYRSGTEFTDAYMLAFGPDDLLYVGGERNGEFSDDGFVLVGYSTAGDSLWAQETDDLIDVTVRHLEVDAAGNAVICGIGSVMIDPENFVMVRAARAQRYSPTGETLDQVTYQAAQVDTIGFNTLAGVDVDADNGIALTLAIFYTSQGSKTTTAHFAESTTTTDWVAEVGDQLGSRTRMLDGMDDGLGNSICTGDFLTFTSGLNTTRIVVKHDAQGDIAWEKRYDTAVDGPAMGIAAATGHDGSVRVYLVPEDDFSGEPLTLRVKKLDADGNQLWEAQKALQSPNLYSIITDALGNTFLSGSAVPEGSDDNAFVVVKFDPDGNEAWTSFHAVPDANAHNGGAAVATDDGGIILPGSAGTGGWFDSDMDFTITKFNADGTLAWSTPVAVENGSGGAVDALIDDAGNIYATGAVQDQTTTEYDHFTAKLSPTGTVLWSQRHGDAAHDERTYTLKQLSTGDIVVVGYMLANDETLNNVLIRYSADGTEQWVTISEDQYFYRDLSVDAADNSYILHQVQGNTFPQRLFNGLFYTTAVVRKVAADGSEVEEELTTGPELSEFYPERLFAHNDGRLVMAGTLQNESFYEGIQLIGSELEVATSIPAVDGRNSGGIGTAYPNPFSDVTRIAVELSTPERVSVLVHDAQGRLVYQVAERVYGAGLHNVVLDAEGLAPGHYTYQLRVGAVRRNGKVVVE